MSYMIGIEREGLRIDTEGNLALTEHPSEFGDRLENPLIGTDFGEAMLELRTHPHPDPKACYEELLKVTREALKVLKKRGELLWPYSVPCNIPEKDVFRYNSYPGRPDMEEHERLITGIYGLKRNCLAGIHVNFSVTDNMLKTIRSRYPNVPTDRDEAYFRCARQILKHEAALRYFFDGSPSDYEGRVTEEDSCRNSFGGFRNEKSKKLDYGNKEVYLRSLKQTMSYERLSALRLKSKDRENFDEGIREHGIERIEFRLCDIDPFDICGISLHEMELVTAVLFLCMIKDEIPDDSAGILAECSDINQSLCLRLKAKEAFTAYADGDKRPLAHMIAQGMKDLTGIVKDTKHERGSYDFICFAAYAKRLYTMAKKDPELMKLAAKEGFKAEDVLYVVEYGEANSVYNVYEKKNSIWKKDKTKIM